MKITEKRLKQIDLYDDEIDLLKKRWPNGFIPTVENLTIARSLGFGIHRLNCLLRLEDQLEACREHYIFQLSNWLYPTFISSRFPPPRHKGTASVLEQESYCIALFSKLLMEL